MAAIETYSLPTARPEEAGVPSRAILAFIDALERAGHCMHGFLIARHGKVLAEGYWEPFAPHEKHRLYSCSKSFVSLAIGFLADEGKISLTDPIVKYFPEILPAGGVHPYIAQTTIRDMLMMASPFEWNHYSEGKDWVQPFFHAPPGHLPGTVFYYDTSASHTMGALVERITGISFLDYLRPRLLNPLGFSQDAYCIPDPSGIAWGGSGVVCTLRDFAKVAMVCLNGGRHEGKQIIPEWYVKEATSRQIDNYFSGGTPDSRQGYGYQFWRCTHNGFSFNGMGGQFAICLPDQDLLVVFLGDDQWSPNGHIPQFSALWDQLYPQLSDEALPERPDEYAALQKRIGELSIVTVPGAFDSPWTKSADGVMYRLDANTMGMFEAGFTFDKDGGIFHYRKAGGRYSIAFGYGKHVRQALPEHSYDCITSGAWGDDHTLNLCCYAVFDFCGTMHITASFKGDTMTLKIGKVAEMFLNDYTGFASGKKM